jgi:hypothetical protein
VKAAASCLFSLCLVESRLPVHSSVLFLSCISYCVSSCSSFVGCCSRGESTRRRVNKDCKKRDRCQEVVPKQQNFVVTSARHSGRVSSQWHCHRTAKMHLQGHTANAGFVVSHRTGCIFWDATPCSVAKDDRRFEVTYCLYLHDGRVNHAKNQHRLIQGISFCSLSAVYKCHFVLHVRSLNMCSSWSYLYRVFQKKLYSVSIHGAERWIVCTPLSVYVFVTLSTQ